VKNLCTTIVAILATSGLSAQALEIDYFTTDPAMHVGINYYNAPCNHPLIPGGTKCFEGILTVDQAAYSKPEKVKRADCEEVAGLPGKTGLTHCYRLELGPNLYDAAKEQKEANEGKWLCILGMLEAEKELPFQPNDKVGIVGNGTEYYLANHQRPRAAEEYLDNNGEPIAAKSDLSYTPESSASIPSFVLADVGSSVVEGSRWYDAITYRDIYCYGRAITPIMWATKEIAKRQSSASSTNDLLAVFNDIEKRKGSRIPSSINPRSFAFVPIVNPGEAVNFRFVGGIDLCSPGSCWTGTSRDECDVALTDSYEIQATETTQYQWVSLMGSNPSASKGNNKPVENVSSTEVEQFISKLNALDRSHTYRLPTEAEWQYAVVKGGIYPPVFWGYGNPSVNKYAAWIWENSGKQTHPVATLLPNNDGVSDLLGNVVEYAYHSECDNRGSGRVLDFKKEVVGNGGSCVSSLWSDFVRKKGSHIGFRLLRTKRT
jgi:hypothetical protein